MTSKNLKINKKELACKYIGTFFNMDEHSFGLDDNGRFKLQIINIGSEMVEDVYGTFEEIGIMTQNIDGSYKWDLKDNEAIKFLKLVREYSDFKDSIDYILQFEKMFVFDLGLYVTGYT